MLAVPPTDNVPDSTGDAANTRLPVPVSSLINVASCAEVVEANWDSELAVVANPVAAPV